MLNHDTSQIHTLSPASRLGPRSTFPTPCCISPTTGYRRMSHAQVQIGIYNFHSLNSNHSGFSLWWMAHHLSTLASWRMRHILDSFLSYLPPPIRHRFMLLGLGTVPQAPLFPAYPSWSSAPLFLPPVCLQLLNQLSFLLPSVYH